MTASQLPAPAPRRGGAAVRGVLPLLAVLAAAPVAVAQPAPVACGNPAFVGLASHAEVDDAGGLRVHLTLTDAPIAPLTALMVAFVDGVGVAAETTASGAGVPAAAHPVILACDAEAVWSVRLPATEAAIHWTLLPWPPVPPALAGLDADAAWQRYADRPPPGRFPWADVERVRAPSEGGWPAAVDPPTVDARGAEEATAIAGPAAQDGPTHDGGALHDDGITWRPGPDLAGLDYLARASVGARLRFDLRFHPSVVSAGRALAACLLDDRQVAPFAGHPTVTADFVAGRAWAIAGEVTVPAPGWHRLTCLLLPDGDAAANGTAPRPLLSAFVWGDP